MLYTDINNIWLAPAFDIVSTTAYIKQDMAALTLMGSRKWWGRKHLIKFGVQHCYLTNQQANELYDECLAAMALVSKQINAELQKDLPGDQKLVLEHFLNLAKKAN